MAIAVFLVWRHGFSKPGVRTALVLFAVQLVLNALWSVAFFGLESPLAGLIVIILLWIAIVLTMVRFAGISTTATFFMVPYIIWVSYAAGLNTALWILNA
jgi:tryptophan-rich sensory protein